MIVCEKSIFLRGIFGCGIGRGRSDDEIDPRWLCCGKQNKQYLIYVLIWFIWSNRQDQRRAIFERSMVFNYVWVKSAARCINYILVFEKINSSFAKVKEFKFCNNFL